GALVADRVEDDPRLGEREPLRQAQRAVVRASGGEIADVDEHVVNPADHRPTSPSRTTTPPPRTRPRRGPAPRGRRSPSGAGPGRPAARARAVPAPPPSP